MVLAGVLKELLELIFSPLSVTVWIQVKACGIQENEKMRNYIYRIININIYIVYIQDNGTFTPLSLSVYGSPRKECD